MDDAKSLVEKVRQADGEVIDGWRLARNNEIKLERFDRKTPLIYAKQQQVIPDYPQQKKNAQSARRRNASVKPQRANAEDSLLIQMAEHRLKTKDNDRSNFKASRLHGRHHASVSVAPQSRNHQYSTLAKNSSTGHHLVLDNAQGYSQKALSPLNKFQSGTKSQRNRNFSQFQNNHTAEAMMSPNVRPLPAQHGKGHYVNYPEMDSSPSKIMKSHGLHQRRFGRNSTSPPDDLAVLEDDRMPLPSQLLINKMKPQRHGTMSYSPQPHMIDSRKKVQLFLPNINSKLDVYAAEQKFVSRSSLGHQPKKSLFNGDNHSPTNPNPFSQRKKGGAHYNAAEAETPIHGTSEK